MGNTASCLPCVDLHFQSFNVIGNLAYNFIWPNMMTWVETTVHFVEMSAIVSCTSHLVQKHYRARDNGQLELFTLLLFGVQWFCSPFPVERCSEMEFKVQTCSSSHLNVSFVYVGVHAVYAVLNGWTVRYKLLVSTIAQKLILLNQQTREFIAPSRSCVVCVDRLHHARDNQDQQRLDQEEEKNGEAKNDDVNSGVGTNGPIHIANLQAVFQNHPKPRNFYLQANYGVVLLLCVESLMAGSTTSVPMSSWYGGYQTATPPPYYPKATYATTSYCTEVFKYYTNKAPDLNSTTYAAPSHYTDALNCYTEAPADYYTEAAKYYSATIYTTITEAANSLHHDLRYTAAPKYYTEEAAYNNVCCLVYYTEAPKYYITKAPEFYTSMYATPAYYIEAPQH
ncbi:hypothetical protein DAPPUDRAFT_318241 [Daphnia pulex]|uniref:Uncharacterized protein n=1 Tax=Daphnia pulex TaxID=6669 RepID=E9GI83_DAPPU|nr:hypothetical protein DAPPUDRAFT_318241 [Daphnia pulex]|eukprot:EFX80816.1 hypothetical protein DAPPUDRAFT_318241 [Daphnia pulex]